MPTESTPDNSNDEQQFVLKNRPDEVERARQALMEAVERREYDAASSFAIRLAVEEALNNAFKHGNENDPHKTVSFSYRVDIAAVEMHIEDQGPGFDVGAVPDPTQPENIEIPCGRGIVLMRAYMTEVEFIPPGNRVRMRFERKSD